MPENKNWRDNLELNIINEKLILKGLKRSAFISIEIDTAIRRVRVANEVLEEWDRFYAA